MEAISNPRCYFYVKEFDTFGIFHNKQSHISKLYPALGAALKWSALADCFRAGGTISKMLAFSENLAWRIWRSRMADLRKNTCGERKKGDFKIYFLAVPCFSVS